MAYTINLTDGTIFATIADGTINQTSSMTLVGKNYAGYGEFLDENFIHALENSANTTAPTAPLTGQLWWDKTTTQLKVYNGSQFKVISSATASSTAPTGNVAGDLWYDSTNSLLKVYTGSTWLTVGPSTVNGTGATPITITDNASITHSVIELQVGGNIVGMVSNDAAFTPAIAIPGFAQVKPGIQLSTADAAFLFQGSATNSQTLDGLDSLSFMRADTNTACSGNINVTGSVTTGLGITNSAGNAVSNIGSTGSYFNNVYAASYNGSGANLTGVVATTVGVLANLSVTGNIVSGNLSVGTGNITVGNIMNANGNGVGNVGNSTSYFNTIFAKATSAQYADVAERFHADTVYQPGTVVELGGSAEITQSLTELSDKVFGVISTRAAYLMNAGAGNDQTHPPIAMTGRVPVRIIGKVQKGDRLVSAGSGIARAAQPGEATAFNTIGRALVDKLDSAVGTVEAIVTIK